MIRTLAICWFVSVYLGTMSAPHRVAGDQPPNILFLFSDDQRVDTIAALGNPIIDTPNIDRLIGSGTYFNRAYCMGSVGGAVCVPSRAMLMGGKTLYRTDMKLSNQTTFPELLGIGGYTTFGTGKWHNGQESFARSFQQGRTIMFGGMSDHLQVPICDMKADYTFTEKRTGDGFSSTLFADAAVDFLKDYRDTKPFFCYVAFSAPHDPRMPPEPFDVKYKNPRPPSPRNFLPQHPFDTGAMKIRDEVLAGWPRTEMVIREQLAEYYGMVAHMDQQIGRILNVLDERGWTENTIIVFASDHGLAMGSHGLLGKQNLYEHSMNTPLVISGPGIPRGQVIDEFTYLFDLYPTVCAYAGVEKIPGDVEGLSLMPVIEGRERGIRQTLFTTYATLIRAVRDDRWKLIRWPQINKTQLFDLENDPDELVNLAEDPAQAERVAEMSGWLVEWQRRVDDQQPLQVDNPKPADIDLSNFQRQPDRWQPKWIVEKYFNDENRNQDQSK